jgi:RNA-directed DNA polymerase
MKNDDIKYQMIGLPAIKNLEDLSLLTHVSKATLYKLSKNADSYYRVFSIPKKSGGDRKISQPSRKLKALQGWILVNILNKLNSSPSCKGFERGTNTLDNASPHIGANAVLSIDIEDFFPSIKSKHVFNIFRIIGYNNVTAKILTNLCTFNNELPQGSPCSPKLANLFCTRLDYRIQKYAGLRSITYTRYADDLTFSCLAPQKLRQIDYTIEKIMRSENLNINHKKTRFSGTRGQKKVTGLVINNESAGIGRDKYRVIRAELHQLTNHNNTTRDGSLRKIMGWLAYMKSVDKTRFNRILKYIGKLKTKNKGTMLDKIEFKKAGRSGSG